MNQYLQHSETRPQIIAITEIKPKNNRYPVFPAEYNIQDYVTYHKNVDNNTGRGIIIYAHESLLAREISLDSDYQESLWIEVQLTGNDKLLIGCVYRSDSGTNDNNDKLLDLINKMTNTKHSHILIMGDFNYKGINWETWSTNTDNPLNNENKFIECLRDNFLHQHVTTPTRGRGSDTPNLLDLVMTNDEQMINDIDHMSPLGKSDHSILALKLNCYSKINTYSKLKIYYNKADYATIKEELNDTQWINKIQTNQNDINKQWEIFTHKINELIKKYVPQKTVTNNKRRNFPLDQNTQKLIKNKHKLWKQYFASKDPEIYKQFCRTRNKVKSITRKAQKNYENSLAKKAKTNPKAIWQYIKSKSKIKEGITELNIDPNDKKSRLTSDSKEKAEILNTYFSSVFTREPDDIMPTFQPNIKINDKWNCSH